MEKISGADEKENTNVNIVWKRMPLHVICMIIVIYTASFDIFLTLDIGGFTFRIAQFFLLVAIMWLILCVIKAKKIYMPVGTQYLLIWAFLQGIFVTNSPNQKNAIGYFLWLLMDIGIIFAMYYSFQTVDMIRLLYRLYVDSFYFISILGLVQLVLGFFEINLYAVQWWTPRWPRLNGFTYEPSYYSTYLLAGWVMVMYLLEKGTVIYTKKQLYIRGIVITLALFLSTSRMGWLMMAVWMFFRFVSHICTLIMRGLTRKKLLILITAVFAVTLVVFIMAKFILNGKLGFLINGLGFVRDDGHSSSTRIQAMMRAFTVFKEHPWTGYSLGGVDPVVAQKWGLVFRNGLSQCVWVEVLVASGALGLVFFAMWLIKLCTQLLRGRKKSQLCNECTSVLWAFVFECIILGFNQNILRIYFWILVGMIGVMGRKCLIQQEELR